LDSLVVMVCGCSRVKLLDNWEDYVDLTYNQTDNGVEIVFCLKTLLTKIDYGFRIPYDAIFFGHHQGHACSKLIQKLPDTGIKVGKADILLDVQPSTLHLTQALFNPAPA